MNDTLMDTYVKEYLVRHILTSSKYNPQDPALEEHFNVHLWDMPLNSMEWKMVGCRDAIILTKEKVSYTINWVNGKARVRPTNEDDKGIRYELGGDFGLMVYRYMLSCTMPVETPPTRLGQLTKYFFTGKHDIVDDVTLRRFKTELVQMATTYTTMQDREPSNYKGSAVRDKVILSHRSGESFVFEQRRPICGWDITWMRDDEPHRTGLRGEESRVLSNLCNQIETNYIIYI